jgi:hypothetical protein
MKSLTRAILFVAILNLLAVLVGAGWLFSSGRLNKARVLSVTELFDQPVSVEEAELKAEQAKIDKELAEQEKPLPELALNTQERNLVRVEMTQVDRQRLERMKREVKNLQETLRKERKLVIADRLAFEEEKIGFAQMRKRLSDLEGGKQFKKSLSTLSGLKSKDAKSLLSTLLTQQKDEEVISYLSAMEDRTRTAIITEFIKAGEDQLAANLLESLRMRGLETTPSDETNQ